MTTEGLRLITEFRKYSEKGWPEFHNAANHLEDLEEKIEKLQKKIYHLEAIGEFPDIY